MYAQASYAVIHTVIDPTDMSYGISFIMIGMSIQKLRQARPSAYISLQLNLVAWHSLFLPAGLSFSTKPKEPLPALYPLLHLSKSSNSF